MKAHIPLLISFFAVAMGELGDKTQFLVLLLAAYFKKPIPIIIGSVLANLASNTVSVLAGDYVYTLLEQETLRPILGILFLILAVWALRYDMTVELPPAAKRYGPFLATLVAYFVADFGDKTQLATLALSARYGAPLAIISGSTMGSLAVDVPTILLAGVAVNWTKVTWAHYVFACLFGALAIITLLGLRF